jgi:transcriptional regulator with XRE-family HTH domain
VDKYIETRKKQSPQFAKDFDKGYEQFKIGVLLKQARIEAGFTQEQVAKKLRTKKSAISRIENHAEDIRLSTLVNYAQAVGKWEVKDDKLIIEIDLTKEFGLSKSGKTITIASTRGNQKIEGTDAVIGLNVYKYPETV